MPKKHVNYCRCCQRDELERFLKYQRMRQMKKDFKYCPECGTKPYVRFGFRITCNCFE